jgi:hypothetical protein
LSGSPRAFFFLISDEASMPKVNVEATASFMNDGKLYRRGDVLALEPANALELQMHGFVRPTVQPVLTTQAAEAIAPRRGYGRRDLRARSR